MMDGNDMGAGGWIAMTLVWVLFLGLIVIVLLRIFPGRDDRATPPASPVVPAPERPLDILDRRLASGEIDLEAYDRLRERLSEAAKGR
jgi:putative membrane protein